MNNIAILGATGSIGQSTVDVVKRHPTKFRAVALSANRDVEKMSKLCFDLRPECVAMADVTAAQRLTQTLKESGLTCRVVSGEQGLCEVAAHPQADTVMAAIVGAAGLLPALAAVDAGKRILLANKEALVMTGQLFIERVKQAGTEIFPIDSEHNAIFQCLHDCYESGVYPRGVSRLVLTASGGPFHADPAIDLATVTPQQAVAHPNWSMGKKISVDSATMMNKGLEVIEAHWLFGLPPELIDVVVHPQSIVHSMVEYLDGSFLAQLGNPDMRTPIANAMAWPERIDAGVRRLDLCEVARLDFHVPDMQRFVCLRLAYDALKKGGTAPAVLNAANEVAVEAFLEGRCRFDAIPRIIDKVLNIIDLHPASTLEAVMAHDALAREQAREYVEQIERGDC